MIPFYKTTDASHYARVNKCQKGTLGDESGINPTPINYLIQRNWFEVRDKLRAIYPQLKEEDVCYEPGKKDAMMRNIEDKLGLSPAKLQRIIAEL